MGAAGRAGEAVGIEGAAAAALAEPLGLGLGGQLGLGLGLGVAGDHFQVLRDGHLRGRLAEVVVGAEAGDRERLVRLAAILGEQRRGDPVDGQVVGVLEVGAALLKLGAGLRVDRDGVGAEKAVQVRLVILAREDYGVDVLEHKGAGGADDGVGLSHAKQGGGEKNGSRHPVSC